MSPISLSTLTTPVYADPATLDVRTRTNDRLSTANELLDQNPIENLYDHVYILREVYGGLITHGPVSHIHMMWICVLLS